METAVLRKAVVKVKRKLRLVRAYLPASTPSDDEFKSAIGSELGSRLRRLPQVFPALGNGSVLRDWPRAFPQDYQRLIETAHNALIHRFNLLGSGWTNLGPSIDWNLDFKSGKRWETRDYRLQKLVDLADGSDVKLPWELSRCQHFIPMALVCLAESEDAYATEFQNQILSWCESNPYLQTVNWSCAMDIAIRCVNWLVAYQLFAKQHDFSPAFADQLVVDLYKGGCAIRANLESSGAGFNTNHYVADLVGLFYLGAVFSETAKPNDWLDFAQSELEREIMLQVDDDGLDYESSLPYHGLVTEFFFYSWLLGELLGRRFSAAFSERLRLMVENLARFTKSDGRVENFGDNDDGRLLRLTGRGARDYRDLLAVAGQTINELRCDLDIQQPEAGLFLSATTASSRQQEWNSIHLAGSGICQMRSQQVIINFFANRVGTAGLGNHKHNDHLSFTYTYRGMPIFVDSGSYVYTASEDERNRFRGTAAHNTVTVDNQEQNRTVRGLLFLLRADGVPRIVEWGSNQEYDRVVAEHNCYERLDDPVTHRRALMFCKRTGLLLLRDELTGGDRHQIDINFHLESMRIESLAPNRVRLRPQHSEREITFGSLDAGQPLILDSCWVSPSYGVKHPALRLSHSLEVNLPYTTTFFIAPLADFAGASLESEISRLCELAGW